jgi:hypothetical protein
MFTMSRRAYLVAAVAAGLALGGCDDSPEQTAAAPTSAAQNSKVPKPADVSTAMVAAVSAGKSATVISVHFLLGNIPTTHHPLPVEIAIVPHRPFTSVRAHFETHDGLSLTSGESFGPRLDTHPEKSLKHRLVLMPEKEGMFMLTAGVETEGDDGTVTRIFSIPVIVNSAGATAPAAPNPSSKTANDSAAPKAN